jgi:Protein of unknown function (DUF3775)
VPKKISAAQLAAGHHLSLISRNVLSPVAPSLSPLGTALRRLPGDPRMPKIPDLSISPEKVFFIVTKSRQSDDIAVEMDLATESDDDLPEDHSKGTDRSELSGFIRGLNVDEQIDLVALMWLGRGDGDLNSWRDLRGEASRAHNNRTASYLIGTPMLADYLEEALSQFGKTFEDFEEHL